MIIMTNYYLQHLFLKTISNGRFLAEGNYLRWLLKIHFPHSADLAEESLMLPVKENDHPLGGSDSCVPQHGLRDILLSVKTHMGFNYHIYDSVLSVTETNHW